MGEKKFEEIYSIICPTKHSLFWLYEKLH